MSSFLNGQGLISLKPLCGVGGLRRNTEDWLRSGSGRQPMQKDPYTCREFHWGITTKVWRATNFLTIECATTRHPLMGEHGWKVGGWVEGRRMGASSLTPCGVVCTFPITWQAWGHVTLISPPLLPSSPSEPGSIATSQGLLKGQWRGASRWGEGMLPLPSFFLTYK